VVYNTAQGRKTPAHVPYISKPDEEFNTILRCKNFTTIQKKRAKGGRPYSSQVMKE